jgi:hypothetical protein
MLLLIVALMGEIEFDDRDNITLSTMYVRACISSPLRATFGMI